MSLCARCTAETESGLCAYHHGEYGEEWATVNRILCDYVHRGMPIPHVSLNEPAVVAPVYAPTFTDNGGWE